jgi:carbon storage regulator
MRNLRRQERERMLVLTRKSNQSIMIGDEIEISVLSVMGDKVRIGIQAPRSVPVYRREVYVAIQREREDELVAEELTAEYPPSHGD